MDDTATQVTDPELLEEAGFRAAKVSKAIELLKIDPRTAEYAEQLPSLMAMAAMVTGTDPGDVDDKQGELADVFQAVYDAWGEAEVHVSDARFAAASAAAGGEAPK
jgi:hypothetical protein